MASMKQITLVTLSIGIGLIGLVLFFNVYRLNQKIEEDVANLEKFENDLLIMKFPRNRIRESDTTYLETGEVFNTVDGVGAKLSKGGLERFYAISIATYNTEFTNEEAFRLDSLKRNLRQKLATSDGRLLSIANIEVQGISGLRYVRQSGQNFERSVMFALANNVIAINTKGRDSVDLLFDKIVNSVKIKKHLSKN